MNDILEQIMRKAEFEAGGDDDYSLDDVPDGITYIGKARIYLTDNGNRHELEVTFLHELLHALAFSTGQRSDHDEQLIDATSQLLHQFETTKSGDI